MPVAAGGVKSNDGNLLRRCRRTSLGTTPSGIGMLISSSGEIMVSREPACRQCRRAPIGLQGAPVYFPFG
jgi:hypothetical protein